MCSEQFEDVEGVLFPVALELHFQSKVGVSMQPATLVDVLRPDSDKPVLSMAQIRAKLHDHIGKLVQIRSCPEVLDSFVLEHGDFFCREAVHLNDFQGLPI